MSSGSPRAPRDRARRRAAPWRPRTARRATHRSTWSRVGSGPRPVPWAECTRSVSDITISVHALIDIAVGASTLVGRTDGETSPPWPSATGSHHHDHALRATPGSRLLGVAPGLRRVPAEGEDARRPGRHGLPGRRQPQRDHRDPRLRDPGGGPGFRREPRAAERDARRRRRRRTHDLVRPARLIRARSKPPARPGRQAAPRPPPPADSVPPRFRITGPSPSDQGVHSPEGTFYVLPKSPGSDDVAFADLLGERDILVLPGSVCEIPGYSGSPSRRPTT